MECKTFDRIDAVLLAYGVMSMNDLHSYLCCIKNKAGGARQAEENEHLLYKAKVGE